MIDLSAAVAALTVTFMLTNSFHASSPTLRIVCLTTDCHYIDWQPVGLLDQKAILFVFGARIEKHLLCTVFAKRGWVQSFKSVSLEKKIRDVLWNHLPYDRRYFKLWNRIPISKLFYQVI